MYLKILDVNKRQFLFKLNSIIGFATKQFPIADRQLKEAIAPYPDSNPDSQYHFDNEDEPIGLDVTSEVSIDPEKIVYFINDKGHLRIVHYSGVAYLINNEAQTLNKF